MDTTATRSAAATQRRGEREEGGGRGEGFCNGEITPPPAEPVRRGSADEDEDKHSSQKLLCQSFNQSVN